MMLVQIVPRLPPATDGLGDYALSLARELRNNFGVESHFIVGDTNWNGGSEIEEFSIDRLVDRSAISLLSSLTALESSCVVLLHYVGYGYARRGTPGWLVNGLHHWRAQCHDARLLTMFHEVYALGPFWSSSF